MKINLLYVVAVTLIIPLILSAQTAQSYEPENSAVKTGGVLDATRFSMHQSASFGMSSSQSYGVQSQSLYTTMLQYQFAKPVTLNLNFGLPIHNTFNKSQNLTTDNIQSMDYLRNMPINASLTWQPTDRFMMRVCIEKNAGYNSYYSNSASGLMYRPLGMLSDW
jgi:hypothetical protein